MKKKIIILSFLMASFCLGINAASKKRTRCTFDQGWTFKLCANHAEASKVLHTLGIANPNLSSPTSAAKKTKVTDDTEPEQAQVTASEITSSNTSSLLSDKTTGKAFRNVTIPHDWSIELPFDPKMGGRLVILQAGKASMPRTSRSRLNIRRNYRKTRRSASISLACIIVPPSG